MPEGDDASDIAIFERAAGTPGGLVGIWTAWPGGTGTLQLTFTLPGIVRAHSTGMVCGANPPAIYNAEGTYTYDDVTGVISADFTSSDFLPECDGPPVGAINLDSEIFDGVLSFVTTDGADQYVDFFSRDSGTTGEILGGWDLIGHYADESGSDNFWWNDSASISCVIRSDGTLSMYGMEADCR